MDAMPANPPSDDNLTKELQQLTKAPPKDLTTKYVEAVMANRRKPPPSYEDLTDELRLLPQPLPVTPAGLMHISPTLQAQYQLPCLVMSTSNYPAAFLAEYVGQALRYSIAGAGEHMVTIATHLLVTGFMKRVLGFLGISCEPYDDSVEPSSAVATAKRPDAQLFLRSVLMFKVSSCQKDHEGVFNATSSGQGLHCKAVACKSHSRVCG